MSNKPLETIMTIAKENFFLRWTVLLLAISVVAMTVLVVKRPPQPAWLIHESGKILVDNKEVFSWQPTEAIRRAFEIMFVPSDNREILLPYFFTGQPLESAQSFKPDVRFTNFRLESQTADSNGHTIVIGTVLRESKKDIKLSIELVQSDRSQVNPFGMKISSTSIIAEIVQ